MNSSEPKPVDCRECEHATDAPGCFACECMGNDGVLMPQQATLPCSQFKPKPPPASPPVSADREGTDVLDAMRQAADALDAVQTCGMDCFENGATAPRDGCKCNTCLSLGEARDAEKVIRRAISSEEALRKRPAGEPDPTLLKMENASLRRGLNLIREAAKHLALATPDMRLRAELERAVTATRDLLAGAVEDPRDAELARLRETIRQASEIAAALPHHGHDGDEESGQHEPDCEACLVDALQTCLAEETPAPDPRDATIRDALKQAEWCVRVRGFGPTCPCCCMGDQEGHSPGCVMAAALRSAGVEPTPEAQEGKAGR